MEQSQSGRRNDPTEDGRDRSGSDGDVVDPGTPVASVDATHLIERVRAALEGDGRQQTSRSRLMSGMQSSVPIAMGSATPSIGCRAEIRAWVTVYVRRLRNDRVPPEQMVVLVKSAMQEAMRGTLQPTASHDLMELVVRWSVAAFYGAED